MKFEKKKSNLNLTSNDEIKRKKNHAKQNKKAIKIIRTKSDIKLK
jgi:hypothetical protein